jgi:hypothetical protein
MLKTTNIVAKIKNITQMSADTKAASADAKTADAPVKAPKTKKQLGEELESIRTLFFATDKQIRDMDAQEEQDKRNAEPGFTIRMNNDYNPPRPMFKWTNDNLKALLKEVFEPIHVSAPSFRYSEEEVGSFKMHLMWLRVQEKRLSKENPQKPGLHQLGEVLKHLAAHYAEDIKAFEEDEKKQMIAWDYLDWRFYPGVSILWNHHGIEVAGTICRYKFDSYHETFEVSMMLNFHMGETGYARVMRKFTVYQYPGLQPWNKLPLYLLTQEDKTKLEVRGRKYIDFTNNYKYRHMQLTSGDVMGFQVVYDSATNYKCKRILVSGSIVVDTQCLKNTHPTVDLLNNENKNSSKFEFGAHDKFPLHEFWSYVFGYSLKEQNWYVHKSIRTFEQ